MINIELAHSFVFTPPEESPQSWDMADLADFPERLADAFPGSSALPVEAWDRNPKRVTLALEIPVADQWLEGLVTTPFPGAGSFSIDHAKPYEAAPVVQWFMENYVPQSAGVEFTTELALDNGREDARQVPKDGDLEMIAQVLAEHAEAIETSLGR